MSELIRLRRLRRSKYDVLCKYLWPVKRTKLQEYLKIENGKDLSVEFHDLSSVRVDLLTEAPDAIYHVEFQTANDLEMHWRMLDYYMRIVGEHDDTTTTVARPINQIVVYIGFQEMDMPSALIGNGLSFEYKLYDIKKQFAEKRQELLSAPEIENKILGLLCAEATPADIWLEVGRAIQDVQQQQKSRAEKLFCMLFLAALLRNLDEGTSGKLLKMAKVIDVEKSPIFRDVFDTGEAEGVLWSIERVCNDLDIPLYGTRPDRLAKYHLEPLKTFLTTLLKTKDIEKAFENADSTAYPSRSRNFDG